MRGYTTRWRKNTASRACRGSRRGTGAGASKTWRASRTRSPSCAGAPGCTRPSTENKTPRLLPGLLLPGPPAKRRRRRRPRRRRTRLLLLLQAAAARPRFTASMPASARATRSPWRADAPRIRAPTGAATWAAARARRCVARSESWPTLTLTMKRTKHRSRLLLHLLLLLLRRRRRARALLGRAVQRGRHERVDLAQPRLLLVLVVRVLLVLGVHVDDLGSGLLGALLRRRRRRRRPRLLRRRRPAAASRGLRRRSLLPLLAR
mmetsp:Transcript_5141/g.21113  ORF Transcript_5141/g.21113 Transcript_5141/m.21113 type:complete len:263 (+) Transcript_5141:366-1154(+)